MKIKIISDSSCDLLTDEKLNFVAVPLTINAGEKAYVDDKYLDVNKLVGDFAAYKGKSGTACPGIGSWLEAFGDAEEIYVITMTSALSGTYNAAMNAKRLYLEQHPDRKVEVFDTRTTAAQQRLIVEKSIELSQSGNSFEKNCLLIKEYILRTRLFFSLESLKNFAQNGRVSKVVAAVAGVLGIKIFGTASEEGTLQPLAKCKAYAGVFKHLLECLKNAGYNGGKVRIAHVFNPDKAEAVGKKITEVFPKADIKIYPARGLCSYYAEKGGLLMGFECKNAYGKI